MLTITITITITTVPGGRTRSHSFSFAADENTFYSKGIHSKYRAIVAVSRDLSRIPHRRGLTRRRQDRLGGFLVLGGCVRRVEKRRSETIANRAPLVAKAFV